MSNFKTWNIRKRHEWLSTPMKKTRLKRRTARRCGLGDAMARNAPPVPEVSVEVAAT